MKQSRGSLPISVFIVLGFLAMGILSIVNYVTDFVYSNDPGGDMYGVIVLACLARLGIPTVLLIVGTILFVSALLKKSKGLRRAGTVLIIIGSVVLLLLSLSAARSGKQRETREEYVFRSTKELIRIARDDDEERMWAMLALRKKNDSAAEPALCKILLDESETIGLRAAAAFVLGRIGGQQAREALEKVQASNPAEKLMGAIKHALEERSRLEKTLEDGKADEPGTEPIDSQPVKHGD